MLEQGWQGVGVLNYDRTRGYAFLAQAFDFQHSIQICAVISGKNNGLQISLSNTSPSGEVERTGERSIVVMQRHSMLQLFLSTMTDELPVCQEKAANL
jgi:hypothetical protein